MTRGENFFHNFIALLVFMAVTVFIIPGCTSDPKKVEIPATADARVELDSLAHDLDYAQNQNIELLSPRNFGKADEYFEKARAQEGKAVSKKEILTSIGLSRAYLNLANENAKRIRPSVSETLDVRRELLNNSGAEVSSKDLMQADNEMREITFEAEKSRSTVPRERASELLNLYRDLRAGTRNYDSGASSQLY